MNTLPTTAALNLLKIAHPKEFCGVDLHHNDGKYGASFRYRAYVVIDDHVFSAEDNENPVKAAKEVLSKIEAFDPVADLRKQAAALGYTLTLPTLDPSAA